MDNNGNNHDIEAEELDTLQIPICDNDLKPRIGLAFCTLKEGEAFYHAYGAACGFTTRRSTMKRANDGTVCIRYVVCTREGTKNVVPNEGSLQLVERKRKRRRSSCRVHCMAKVIFRFQASIGYIISKFIEGHNHQMVSGGYRRLLKIHRNVDSAHQMFIARCAKANVGASKAFHIFKEMAGGYEDVGCRKTDFKNMARDMKSSVEGADAQLLLEKFGRMREKNDGFFFSYSVDEVSNLTGLFWADLVAVQNYQIFGDAVSVDATYSTNRYSLIFTPFTGRDNHGKCVNFGAALISKEDGNVYSWLLSQFVECMGSPPKMLITDQDLGLKYAVQKVLPKTRHRWCMWHIMMKLTEKVPVSVRENGEFFQKFDEMVWSDIDEPLVFEQKWQDIMTEFGLVGHKWFDSMYVSRMFWVPAYFCDLKMSGLFRTTSLSESENSFFRRFLNKNANLSELYMLFELAIQSQREDHDALTLSDETCSNDLVNKIQLEQHAASVYTKHAFFEIQKEIEVALLFCTIPKTLEAEGEVVYDVDEDAIGVFKVNFNILDDFISCSCNLFVRKGMVCMHMFAVMRVLKYKTIPEKYIERRWTKGACLVFDDAGQNRYALENMNRFAANRGIFNLACKCIGLADGQEELMEELTKVLSEFYDGYADIPGSSSSSKGK